MTRTTPVVLSERVKKLSWAAGILWTVIVLGLYFYDIKDIKRATFRTVTREAVSHFNKDWASRLWAASHGGVYVPVSEKTPPNPFLEKIPERDIVTPSGKKLTLLNPAYMLRQMMDHYADLYGIRAHITSLKHFRKETAPDPWEESSLLSFERGTKENAGVHDLQGKPYYRLMRPLATEESCLKCHGEQGYKVGDIRGGISVSVPLSPYLVARNNEILTRGISFLSLWVLGLAGIGFAGWSLKGQAEERQKLYALYTSVAEHSLTGIYIIQNGKIIYANRRFAEIYGFPREEIIGMDSLDLAHGEDRAKIEDIRRKRLSGRPVPSEYEIRGVKKNGEIIRIQARNALIEYQGKPAIVGNALDVTALRRAEESSKEHQLELEKKNRELDAFASVAAHDLQEPLRKIKAFGDLLHLKHGNLLGEQGRDYLNRMRDAAARMEKLIESLLTYSRLATRGEGFTRVDLNDAAAEALSNLGVRIQETGGDVEVEHLPTICGERSQIVQLFQNLIGNALKFHRKGRCPHVRISCAITEAGNGDMKACEIRVQDNGIGFDRKHIDRIFAPFERLHGRNLYEGVGMGLAICRKIVERHGGKITADSTPGQGSVFQITLPLG